MCVKLCTQIAFTPKLQNDKCIEVVESLCFSCREAFGGGNLPSKVSSNVFGCVQGILPCELVQLLVWSDFTKLWKEEESHRLYMFHRFHS